MILNQVSHNQLIQDLMDPKSSHLPELRLLHEEFNQKPVRGSSWSGFLLWWGFILVAARVFA